MVYSSSSLLRVIAVAIFIVLALHWYLMLHLEASYAPHNYSLLESTSTRATTPATRHSYKKKPSYILSSVCGGCYRAYRGKCFDIIQQHKDENNSTLLEAMQSVGKSGGPECSVCDPDACYKPYISGDGNEEEDWTPKFKYWRYDAIAPRYSSAHGLLLQSIPNHLRIPPSRYNDIEEYIRQVYKDPDPSNTSNSFLFEYNPSLATIPTEMKSYLPLNAVYVAALRVTPSGRCMSRKVEDALPENIKQTMHSLCHLGIALLDDKYQVIPGYDVVIDLDVQLDLKRWKVLGEPTFSDYRLFLLNGELYLNINSDTVVLTKLRLSAKGFGSLEDEADVDKDGERPIKLKNLYGRDQLEVTLLHQFNSIWGRQVEGSGERWSNFDKNYALFSRPDRMEIYAEITVSPEHRVRQIIPDEYEQNQMSQKWIRSRARRNFRTDSITSRRVKIVDEYQSSRLLSPSFFTVDELWFPGKRNPYKSLTHGGACCISLPSDDIAKKYNTHHHKWKGIDTLLVGVGHNKITVRIGSAYGDAYSCQSSLSDTLSSWFSLPAFRKESTTNEREGFRPCFQLRIIILCIRSSSSI